MKNIKRFNRLFRWLTSVYDGGYQCDTGPYELRTWPCNGTWSARVDSMTLMGNPLKGIEYPSHHEAMAACQSAVLKIERETATLQRFSK
jgi:hypothetical protein